MTINELFDRFSQAAEWRRLATVSRCKVSDIILKPHGQVDADTLTREQLKQWVADSKRPPSDTAPTESVISHMMIWSKRWTEVIFKPTPKPIPKAKSDDRTIEGPKIADVDHHEDRQRRVPPTTKRKTAGTRRVGKSVAKPAPSVAKPRRSATPKPKAKQPKRGEYQQTRRKADVKMSMDDWENDTRARTGTIEHERSSKGWRNGKRVFKDNWRAVIMVNGQRYRHRGGSREECSEWLKAVLQKKILPTDTRADWWRMEQRRDEKARIDEIIVSQAEESVMLYDYHQTGDITKINEYIIKCLLPHMMYYAAHTLRLGRISTITASRQAAGLLLTRITAHRPVLNFTSTCKRMLRVYKQRGDFFYYEQAPEEVKLMVNRINFDGLAEVWKVTKDRRL